MTKTNLILSILLISTLTAQEKPKGIKNPKTAFWFSLVPGMGQIYNGKWIKSATIIGLEIAAYQAWQNNADIYSSYEGTKHTLPKHRYLEKRNKYAWWVWFIYVYGMIDAVVDAHLHPFEEIMKKPIEENQKEEERKYEE